MWKEECMKIIECIADCEEVQESGVSEHTKQQAKISAYNHIKEILGFKES